MEIIEDNLSILNINEILAQQEQDEEELERRRKEQELSQKSKEQQDFIENYYSNPKYGWDKKGNLVEKKYTEKNSRNNLQRKLKSAFAESKALEVQALDTYHVKETYNDKYQDIVSGKFFGKSRADRIKNKNDRLYAKDKNAKAFEKLEEDLFAQRDQAARLRYESTDDGLRT